MRTANLIVFLLLASSCALDNGLGATPPLAWSSWNALALGATEDSVLANARALVSTGLAAAGYTYINIDAGYLAGRDASGKLIVNKARYPSGIANLSATLHAMRLKLGVYTDLSGVTCGDGPGTGSKGHYDLDAATFAEWGADYLKVDFCGPCDERHGPCDKAPSRISVKPAEQLAAWSALRDALNRTNHSMYLSICPHTVDDGVGTERPWQLPYAPPPQWTREQRRGLANSLLVEYSNTADQWLGGPEGGIAANIDAMLHATQLSYSGKGSWNDADMLQACNYGKGHTPGHGMTLAEYRAHYAVWAILASPLILGVDLRSLAAEHPDCLAVLLNKDILAVNQDALAAAPRLVWQTPQMRGNLTSSDVTGQVLARPLSGGKLAVLMLNRAAAPRAMSVTWDELGLAPGGSLAVYDVIAQRAAGTANGSFAAVVPSHDVSFVVLG